MDPASGNESNKKINFEDLSKEELIQKCYSLLTIAQKAKHSKNILNEEIQKLKDELSKTKIVSSGTEEIINKLTQKNLTLTMTIDELTSKNKSLVQRLEQCEVKLRENQEKIYTLDNENGSFKRQIHRLVDENEQLLTNLDALEKQIEKLNQLGIEQQNQLLQLEKKQISEKNDNVFTDKKDFINQFENLKEHEKEMHDRLINCDVKILEKDNQLVELQEELANKNTIITELSSKCDNLLKSLDEISVGYKDETNKLEGENKKMKEKLKLFHSKIIKLAGDIKMLREDKNHILNLSKSYVHQVSVWKEELQSAKKKFLQYITNIETENNDSKLKLEDFKTAEMKMISLFNEEREELQAKSENEIDKLQKEIEKQNKINSNMKYQIDNLKLEVDHYKQEMNSLKIVNNEENMKANKDNLHCMEELKQQNSNLLVNNEELNKQIEELNNSISILNNEIKTSSEKNEEYKYKLSSIESEREISKKEINELKNRVISYETEVTKFKSEQSLVCESEKNLSSEIKLLQDEKDKLLEDIRTINDKYNILLEQYHAEKLNFEKTILNLTNEIKSHQELGAKSSEQIENLIRENNIHLTEIEKLKQDSQSMHKNVCNVECQTDSVLLTEMEQQISDLKRENAELLSDMNEMNQELKERGENISKLQAHCEEILKKLQVYETQANKNIDSMCEKDKIIESLTTEIEKLTSNKNNDEEITQLKVEIEYLKEKINQNFDSSVADNETMSTSTISRTEEINRLKDLEGSWEERYGKLRNLAIKLKGKIRELNGTLIQQQNENEEIQKKLSGNIQTIQSMQVKCDTLEDELNKSQAECKQYLNRLNQIGHDISTDKQHLASKDEIIFDLKQKVEQFNKEKMATENWKKQVSVKIQTLRRELEAKELIRKELELKIVDLSSEVQKKDEVIKTESDSHNHTKELLEQLNDQVKKNSMLNLEMQDYERSMKDITKKMDKQQEHIIGLKSQIESQKLSIQILKEENKMLEEKLLKEQQIVLGVNSELEIYKNKIHKYEENLKEKDDTIESITKLSEKYRAEVEELSIELSNTIAEHQKTGENLRNERDHLRNQTVIFQQNIRDIQNELNLKIEELTNIKTEYEGYKIRAQSVLRQNQNRDIGFEEKLLEEINSLKIKNSSLQTELDDYK